MPKDPIVIGAGLAAYGLATAILGALQAKNILTNADVHAIFEGLLSDTEKSGVYETPEGRAAYELLASVAAKIAPPAKPSH